MMMNVIEPIQQIVLNCLNHFAFQDAIFLSERLHSEFQSEESIYLLALSYYRSGGKALRTYHILKERQLKLPKSKYLLAKCCLDLNKYGEAESVLISDCGLVNGSSSATSNTNKASDNASSKANSVDGVVPGTATSSSNSTRFKLHEEITKEYGAELSPYVLQILATVYSKTDRVSQAVDFYKRSLRQNPFIWSSFEAICNIGEKVDPAKYFTFHSALNAYKPHALDSNTAFVSSAQSIPHPDPETIQLNHHHHHQQQQPTQLNILKQIDQQNDNLEQKNKQDISQILRMVEVDQQSKLAAQKQRVHSHHSHHHHHHHHHVHQHQHQQPTHTGIGFGGTNKLCPFAFKENSLNSQTEDHQQLTPVALSQCCCCCCFCPVTAAVAPGAAATSQQETIPSDQSTSLSFEHPLFKTTSKNTPLLNQVLGKSTSTYQQFLHMDSSSSSSTSTTMAPQSTITHPSTSHQLQNTSMSTPPQLISSNNLTLAPVQKKCVPKRHNSATTATGATNASAANVSKPLFGQNTTNSMVSQTTNINMAQYANLNAVKENKKLQEHAVADNDNSDASATISATTLSEQQHAADTAGAILSSSASSSSSSLSSNQSANKTSKRIKLKKNRTTLVNKYGTEQADMNVSDEIVPQFKTQQQQTLDHRHYHTPHQSGAAVVNGDTDKSLYSTAASHADNCSVFSCTVQSSIYAECHHCSLLSNQSKNAQLNYNNLTYLNAASGKSVSSLQGGATVAATPDSSSMTLIQTTAAANQAHSLSNAGSLLGLRKHNAKHNIMLIDQSIFFEHLMHLFKDLGYAYSNLKQYECEKALDYFDQLPPAQCQSSYVLSHMAKAHFELHNYPKAESIYLQLRRKFPYHLDGIEYYSTTLWHLQKEIALSALAQELTEYDKLAPETWCVVGNCFSLHKEHDAAIKFFQRATQVDPKFVYAYNLLGHEYFLIEEMDKGLSCFRKAIFLDSRHYNAWYGISMIHLKQEKFLLAEKYLKKALLINPHSSTLMCHIAVVYHSLRQSDKALQILERALTIEPRNALCKFHRASILFSMEKYDESLDEFEKLRRIIPKESLIYYMISKTHKKLKNVHLSLMYMSWAMDLDPKGVNNQLKESIDKRYVVDSDSTFARELETINTSTLDAIYGGISSNIVMNNENTTVNTTNNNVDGDGNNDGEGDEELETSNNLNDNPVTSEGSVMDAVAQSEYIANATESNGDAEQSNRDDEEETEEEEDEDEDDDGEEDEDDQDDDEHFGAL